MHTHLQTYTHTLKEVLENCLFLSSKYQGWFEQLVNTCNVFITKKKKFAISIETNLWLEIRLTLFMNFEAT